jgi:transposase
VVDAIGLPIRIHPTPGQWGDRPQAETLLAGLKGVGHAIADAAYDADPLRAFIVDDLGATAHIKANPSREPSTLNTRQTVTPSRLERFLPRCAKMPVSGQSSRLLG